LEAARSTWAAMPEVSRATICFVTDTIAGA
jgi:hypothetical protein